MGTIANATRCCPGRIFACGKNINGRYTHRIKKQIESLPDEMGERKRDIAVRESPASPLRHHNPQMKDLHGKMVRRF